MNNPEVNPGIRSQSMKSGSEFTQAENQDKPKPAWFGVTVGSLAYAVHAVDQASARRLTFRAIGIPQKENKGNIVPTFVDRHPDEFQGQLTELYGARRQAVRVIPFSIDRWPKPAQAETELNEAIPQGHPSWLELEFSRLKVPMAERDFQRNETHIDGCGSCQFIRDKFTRTFDEVVDSLWGPVASSPEALPEIIAAYKVTSEAIELEPQRRDELVNALYKSFAGINNKYDPKLSTDENSSHITGINPIDRELDTIIEETLREFPWPSFATLGHKPTWQDWADYGDRVRKRLSSKPSTDLEEGDLR